MAVSETGAHNFLSSLARCTTGQCQAISAEDLRGVGFIDPRGLAGGRFYRGFWVFTFSHTKSGTNVLLWKKVE